MEVPRSKIYVSPATLPEPPNEKKYAFQLQHNQDVTHYYLVLSSELYTADLIQHCNGRLNCYNCGRPIPDRIYFYPTRVNTVGAYECSQLPHCRKECMKRTVLDTPNNSDLLMYLHNMYGDMESAPHRSLLYIPGGWTLAQYHDSIDQKMVVEVEPPRVQSFLGPVFLSAAITHNHQMVESSLQALDRLANQNTVDITELASQQPANVITLQKKSLFDGPLSIFAMDTSCPMPENVHMEH